MTDSERLVYARETFERAMADEGEKLKRRRHVAEMWRTASDVMRMAGWGLRDAVASSFLDGCSVEELTEIGG